MTAFEAILRSAFAVSHRPQRSVAGDWSLYWVMSTKRPFIPPIFFTVRRLAVPEIPRSGTPDQLLDDYGISARHIVASVRASTLPGSSRTTVSGVRVSEAIGRPDEPLYRASDVSFHLIHSLIVFQHIPVERGLRLIERLLGLARSGGIVVLQVLYDNPFKRAWPVRLAVRALKPLRRRRPEIQMHPYPLDAVLRLMHRNGVRNFRAELTDHAGHLGRRAVLQGRGLGPRAWIKGDLVDESTWHRSPDHALLSACRPAPHDAPAARSSVDPWEEARGRGIDFRALGQEPGWFLEIDEGRSMHLVYDYMEREATAPAPARAAEGTTIVYHGSAAGRSLT